VIPPQRGVLALCGSYALIGVGPEWGLEHRPFRLHPEVIIAECSTSLLVVRQYEPALAQQALPSAEQAALPPPRPARLQSGS